MQQTCTAGGAEIPTSLPEAPSGAFARRMGKETLAMSLWSLPLSEQPPPNAGGHPVQAAKRPLVGTLDQMQPQVLLSMRAWAPLLKQAALGRRKGRSAALKDGGFVSSVQRGPNVVE